MNRNMKLLVSTLASLTLVATLAGCTDNPPWWRPRTTTTRPGPGPGGGETPIVFVHGIIGSGDQYRAIAQYFASNGFPAERIKALDYNSTGGTAPLDAFVDSVRREFGVEKVHLVGHSLGTTYVGSYGNNNAAKVDKYILVDGLPCSGGGARCLEIRAASLPAGGGRNQTHVEASVSSESFVRQYQHLMGRAPSTTRVTPETGPTVRLAGRVQEFQVNRGIANATLEFWAVDPETAARVGDSPAATARTGADGFFPAVTVPRGGTYEIAVPRPGPEGTFHYYFQAFERSDLLLRLNMTDPNSATARLTNRGPNHSAMAVVRNREFWPNSGAQSDRLTIETTTPDRSQPEVDVFQIVKNQAVGVHIHDNGTPGQSSLTAISGYGAFQAGVDVFMPAATPPNGTIKITNIPRGDASNPQTINVANWPSDTNGISVSFSDWAP